MISVDCSLVSPVAPVLCCAVAWDELSFESPGPTTQRPYLQQKCIISTHTDCGINVITARSSVSFFKWASRRAWFSFASWMFLDPVEAAPSAELPSWLHHHHHPTPGSGLFRSKHAGIFPCGEPEQSCIIYSLIIFFKHHNMVYIYFFFFFIYSLSFGHFRD